MGIRLWCLLFILSTTTLFADNQVRDVQEELRKRNLYFGEVDGRMTPDLANALKRYQERKASTLRARSTNSRPIR
jgi:peptidoglycan hydrolase-like protein with peptidoglycan-binding domain